MWVDSSDLDTVEDIYADNLDTLAEANIMQEESWLSDSSDGTDWISRIMRTTEEFV